LKIRGCKHEISCISAHYVFRDSIPHIRNGKCRLPAPESASPDAPDITAKTEASPVSGRAPKTNVAILFNGYFLMDVFKPESIP
jgi:hypothetical protein